MKNARQEKQMLVAPKWLNFVALGLLQTLQSVAIFGYTLSSWQALKERNEISSLDSDVT